MNNSNFLTCSLILATCSFTLPSPAVPKVTLCTVESWVRFTETIKAQGTVRTKESAAISARVPGTVCDIFVSEGDAVTNGTALFEIDRVNLANAVRAAEDDLAMAKASLTEREATLRKAESDEARMRRLVAAGAVTTDLSEKAATGAERARAAVTAAKAMITKAETGLRVAEKHLADATGRAPFDGIVTRKLKDIGDFVGAGMPIFLMDNTAAYEVRFNLAASWYPKVAVGKTKVVIQGARSKEQGVRSKEQGASKEFFVTYKAPSINPVSRTFEVRVALPAGIPGELLDLQVVLSDEVCEALPASAVNPLGGEMSVYVIENGRLKRRAVRTGLEQNGKRAVYDLPKDLPVVKDAMLLYNEGQEVEGVSL